VPVGSRTKADFDRGVLVNRTADDPEAADSIALSFKGWANWVGALAVTSGSNNPSGIAQFGAIQAAAVSLGVAVSPIDVQDASEIERSVAAFVRSQMAV
jgi:hypothetical protein